MAVVNGKRVTLTGDTGITLKFALSILGFLLACGGVVYERASRITTRLDSIETILRADAQTDWNKHDDADHMAEWTLANGMKAVPHHRAEH